MAAETKPSLIDFSRLRRDFPILATRVNGRPLVYLDSAASAQKPEAVVNAMTRFVHNDYANVHRGIHAASCAVLVRRYQRRFETVNRLGLSADRCAEGPAIPAGP